MSNTDSVTYTCPECGYVNVWTRDEVIQRGDIIDYRVTPSTLTSTEDRYSLKCRNPALLCPARMIVAIKRER